MTVNLSALAGAGQQFFDNNGNPLSGGKLYSYEAGTTTPKATYTTSAGNVAHTNPIVLDSAGRVSSGEIWLTSGANYKFSLFTSTDVLIATWDNIPALVADAAYLPYTPGANSLLTSTTVAGALDDLSDESSGASVIGYNQGDSGAVNRTVEARLQDFVSVADFGADPTGVADSRQAIIDAINASTKIYFPPGTYTSSATIQVLDKDIEISGNGASLTFTTGYLYLGGSIGDTYTLAANADFGANVFTVTGGDFAAGDIMQLVDTADYSMSLHRSYYHEGQLFTVVSAASNVITTAENALASWTTGGGNITVKKISPVKITINGLNVLAPTVASSAYAARIIYAKDFYTENCIYRGGETAGIVISDSLGINVLGCECTCTAPSTTGTQYGISIDDSSNVLIDGCALYGTRHAVGLGGSGNAPPKFIVTQNSTLSSKQDESVYTADIHGNCSYVTYQNNTIYGGAAIAGEYASYLNNVIFANPAANADPAINFAEVVGGNFIIDGNQIYMPTNNNNTAVIGSTATSFWSKINYSYHAQITSNEISCNANNTSIATFGTHYLAPTVQPSVTWENNKFRNDCSAISRIIRISSVANPVGTVYVAATGPFFIKDFTLHSTMTSAVKIFSVSAGTIATGAKFFLPEINIRQSFNVVSGTSTRTAALTFPFDYGSVTPGVQATVENTTVQNGHYLFAGVDALTATGCTGVVTTGNTGATLSADTAYTANFRIGGPKTS